MFAGGKTRGKLPEDSQIFNKPEPEVDQMIRWMRGEVVLRINFHVSALPEPAELLRQKSIRPARAACICPNYVTLIMFPPQLYYLLSAPVHLHRGAACVLSLPLVFFLSLAPSSLLYMSAPV